MVYEAGKRLTKREIDLFENAKDIREIQYLGTRLVDEQCEYEPEKIAEYAIRKGYASRLSYLAETALKAARRKNLQGLQRVKRLIDLLYFQRDKHYKFLFPDKRFKKLAIERSTSPLNKKWKVYSDTHARDINEYISLYLIDLRQGIHIRNAVDLMREYEEYNNS